ncbi:hypothetical protein M5689_020697 [Euphorbia peplus]|nr:hypothetical protein M5689_020696 [Euphorbia peplus]WCJ39731.1 hypothetical protein M5689_020697 [Euphorbia peplus]
MSENPAVQALLSTMEWSRLSHEEVARIRASFHSQYGVSGGNDMLDMPYMSGAQYDALSAAFGEERPDLRRHVVGGREDLLRRRRAPLKFARAALNYFIERAPPNFAAFEVVDAFFSEEARMVHPRPRPTIKKWLHPSSDPGFRHSCLFCPADQKFHPGPNGGYEGGRPPCHQLEYLYG